MPTIKYARPDSTESSAEYIKQVADGKPVIVYVTASWCGPCQYIAPVVEELSEKPEYADQISIIKMDVDQWREDTRSNEDLKGSSVPRFFGFDGEGTKVSEFKGASEEKLANMIQELVGAKA